MLSVVFRPITIVAVVRKACMHVWLIGINWSTVTHRRRGVTKTELRARRQKSWSKWQGPCYFLGFFLILEIQETNKTLHTRLNEARGLLWVFNEDFKTKEKKNLEMNSLDFRDSLVSRNLHSLFLSLFLILSTLLATWCAKHSQLLFRSFAKLIFTMKKWKWNYPTRRIATIVDCVWKRERKTYQGM